MYKVEAKNIPALLDTLAMGRDLYLPARNKAGKVDYAKYAPDTVVDFQTAQTAKSPKDIFFPQVENLLRFQQEGKHLSLEQLQPEDRKVIIMGLRACDARSFAILDKVFLVPPVDTYYKKRREQAVLIGMACSDPEETCFCGSFRIDPTRPEADVITSMVQGDLYWQVVTSKGEELTKTVLASGLLVEAAQEELELCQAQGARAKAILKELPLGTYKFNDGLYADELKTFKDPKWAELSSNCLSCCVCTYICPTCHCYDIRDYKVSDTKVERYRCWDSCMCRDFTKMAHGNPRKTKLERFRQRYMHKLVYFPENHQGTYACVGCGRCLQKCPVNLNIVKVAKVLEVSQHV